MSSDRMPNSVHALRQILVVDDTPGSLRMLAELLSSEGYEARPVPSGELALKAAFAAPPDLILLDVQMPGLSGYEVCAQLKAAPSTREIPVIFISALDDIGDKLRAFEVGGVDYVTKPFQFPEVLARVHTHLTICELTRALEREKRKSEDLLYNMMPRSVASELREDRRYEGRTFEEVTVLHCNIVGFSELMAKRDAQEVLALLDELVRPFDGLCGRHGLLKLAAQRETYLIAGGAPEASPDHANTVAAMALDMLEAARGLTSPEGRPIELTIGIHSGAAVGGVVGARAPQFALFGDPLEGAAQLGRACVPEQVQISEATQRRLDPERFITRARGGLDLPGYRRIDAHFLLGRADDRRG